MKEELGRIRVPVHVDVVDSLCVERRAPSDNTVNDITLGQEKLGQIGAVLTGNPCYESFLDCDFSASWY